MRYLIVLLTALLTACESNPPAPIIDRAPETKPKPPLSKSVNKAINKNTDAGRDWRPDSHMVKKGDTLFGIGLEYGVDYKEIAVANNIAPPYPIKIGQIIDLKSFKVKPAGTPEANNSAAVGKDDGVIITPMKTDPAIVTGKPAAEKPIASAVTPVLSEPKATREPYSLEALNRSAPKPINSKPVAVATSESKTAETKPTEVKPGETKPADTKPLDNSATGDEAISWKWPTQGKVTAGFNEATNKGIDIGGETGQGK